MKFTLFVLSLLFTCTTFTFAQNNYQPGFIVKNNGDTTKGFINYKERELNPKQIIFKTALAAKESNMFSVADIKAFGVTDIEYFERYKLLISQDETNPTNLGDRAIDTTLKADIVFAKVIVKGPNINLFSYTDSLKTRFYIAAPNSESLEELGYHLKPIFGEGVASTSNYSYKIREEYKQQLTLVAQKAAVLNRSLAFKIEKAVYNERDLKSIVERINNNNNTFKSKNLFGYRLFAGAGVNMGSFHLGGKGTFPADITVKNPMPEINAGILLYPNKFTQQIYLKAVLSYSQHHYAYKDVVSSSNNSVTSSLDFKQNNISFAGMFGYNVYNKPDFKVFVDAGLGANFSGYNKYAYIENFYNSTSTVHPQYPELSKIWFNVMFNAGVEISKRVTAYVGYSPPSKITGYNGFGATISSYRAGLTYIFGKL